MKFHVYIGFDNADLLAYLVCVESLKRSFKSSVLNDGLCIHTLTDAKLRKLGLFSRPSMTLANGQRFDINTQDFHSTDFTFSRFLVPWIHLKMGREGPALFIDPDTFIRSDIRGLFTYADKNFDVLVVKHDYRPPEESKIFGAIQQNYDKKNWSSVMLFPDCSKIALTPEIVSAKNRDFLHGFKWANPIGSLPLEWNFLDGFSQSPKMPKLVHYTLGTPDYRSGCVCSDEWWAVADLFDSAEI